jgi:uncharacterized membrane protein YecN with MAPEG domain
LPIPVIVPAYAALLAIVFIFLSVRVIRARRGVRVAIGTGGQPSLERVQRVHANFAEYVPIALILFTFVEMHRWPFWLVHLLCALFLIGRMLHAYGVSQDKENFQLRVTGMTLTFTLIGSAALLLLFDALRA